MSEVGAAIAARGPIGTRMWLTAAAAATCAWCDQGGKDSASVVD
jgi:hypothetical protein